MEHIRNRFNILLAEKEFRDGRQYTYDDIRDLTGLARGTLSFYAQNKIQRYDSQTVATLCRFFECELTDLLELSPAATDAA